MRRSNLVPTLVLFLIVGLSGCTKPPPPPPQTIDAPKLASAIKWLGVCAVLCSAFGATALIIASHTRRK